MERRRWLGAGDHLIAVDVTNAVDGAGSGGDDVVVVVEPTYGSVAVAAALDAGWRAVEIAGVDAAAAGGPIPLVSYEQRPPAGATRCRVRSDDLAAALAPLRDDRARARVLLGAPAFARPLASALARASSGSVRFVACPAPDGAMAADAWWACGMLVRVLLEELDDHDARLTDAAGIAVTVARGAEDASAQLSAGARWREHVAAGGHPDDLRIASAVDSIGAVPVVTFDAAAGALAARRWAP